MLCTFEAGESREAAREGPSQVVLLQVQRNQEAEVPDGIRHSPLQLLAPQVQDRHASARAVAGYALPVAWLCPRPALNDVIGVIRDGVLDASQGLRESNAA